MSASDPSAVFSEVPCCARSDRRYLTSAIQYCYMIFVSQRPELAKLAPLAAAVCIGFSAFGSGGAVFRNLSFRD